MNDFLERKNPQILKYAYLLFTDVLVLSHNTYLKNSPCSLKQHIK